MKKKMNAKQGVTGGLALEDWIKEADPSSEPASSQVTSAVVKSRGAGRPPASPEELRNKNMQIKLTEAEYEALKVEAGRIPLAVFVRDKMKDAGII